MPCLILGVRLTATGLRRQQRNEHARRWLSEILPSNSFISKVPLRGRNCIKLLHGVAYRVQRLILKPVGMQASAAGSPELWHAARGPARNTSRLQIKGSAAGGGTPEVHIGNEALVSRLIQQGLCNGRALGSGWLDGGHGTSCRELRKAEGCFGTLRPLACDRLWPHRPSGKRVKVGMPVPIENRLVQACHTWQGSLS